MYALRIAPAPVETLLYAFDWFLRLGSAEKWMAEAYGGEEPVGLPRESVLQELCPFVHILGEPDQKIPHLLVH